MLGRWRATVRDLDRHKGKKYSLGALLRDCKTDAIALEGDTLVLPFAHRPNMERMQEEMDDPQGRRLVSEAIAKFFGAPYGFKIIMAGENADGGNPIRQAQQSPLVRAALGMGARIKKEEVVE